MARPRSFDKTQVLKSIKDTFWSKGYKATSLEELTEATGLGKGSLYAAFGDKNSMYCLALEHYEEEEVTAAVSALTTRPGEPPSAPIGRLFSAVIQAVEDNDLSGCFLCNASLEMDQLSTEGAAIVQRGQNTMVDAIAAALGGDPTLKATQQKAYEIFAVYFGMRVMARSGVSIEALNGVRQSALQALD